MMAATQPIPLYPVSGNSAVVKDIKENTGMGFIKLFRSVREHWIWADPVKFQWWVDILMECNHEDKKVNIGFDLFDCKRGQTLHSRLEWSKRWRVDESTVRRFLSLLEQDGMVKLENLQKTTRLTVCKYDSYNRNEPASNRHRKSGASQTQDKQEGKEFKEKNSTPPEGGWLYSHKGFFDRQIASNAGEPEIENYRILVQYLHGKNPDGIRFDNVLSLAKQISYKDFVQLKEVAKTSGRTIKKVLTDMENRATLAKDYKNVYLTARNWLQRDFKD